MRLINVRTLELEEFIGRDVPPYAILSHTWEEQEVSFNNFKDPAVRSRMEGSAKIQKTCDLARDHDLEYAWVDT